MYILIQFFKSQLRECGKKRPINNDNTATVGVLIPARGWDQSMKL